MVLNAIDRRPLPDGWRWVKVGEVCDINPRRPTDLHRLDDTVTTFVPMSAVDELLGEILRPEVKAFGEVRKGYTYFEEGDVLFAKITPCMQNGKHVVARNLIGGFGFGTTEFHVLRPGPEIIEDWVHRFLRQPSVLQAATAHFTGAVGQQRVPESYLAGLSLALPPLPEQRRIAAILNEQMAAVERARAACEAQVAAARALPAAYLREMFESEEAQRWPKKPLGEVGRIGSGITLGRQLGDLKTRKIPYLRVANVKDGRLDLSDVYQIDATEAEIKRCMLQFGDILLTEGGDPDKLGRGTFWDGQLPECIHQNHIYRVRFDLDHFSPEFLSAQIGSPYGKAYFLAHAKQTTGIATINQKVLGQLPLMIPSRSTQDRVAAKISQKMMIAEQMLQALVAQLDAINHLPAALLRRAFNGEL